MVAWADTQISCGMQLGSGPISSIPPWRKTHNFTEEANAHGDRNFVAEQHDHWQEQGSNALNLQHADFARAAQAAHDEVHVPVMR